MNIEDLKTNIVKYEPPLGKNFIEEYSIAPSAVDFDVVHNFVCSKHPEYMMAVIDKSDTSNSFARIIFFDVDGILRAIANFIQHPSGQIVLKLTNYLQ